MNNVSTSITGSYQIKRDITLQDIAKFREQCKNLPHPCLSFFLQCYDIDRHCDAIYDGDHIIVSCAGHYFDCNKFDVNFNKSAFLPLKSEGLRHLLLTFDSISMDEIEILIKYLKQ